MPRDKTSGAGLPVFAYMTAYSLRTLFESDFFFEGFARDRKNNLRITRVPSIINPIPVPGNKVKSPTNPGR